MKTIALFYLSYYSNTKIDAGDKKLRKLEIATISPYSH